MNLTGTSFDTATDVFFGTDGRDELHDPQRHVDHRELPCARSGRRQRHCREPERHVGRPAVHIRGAEPTLTSLTPPSGSTLGGNTVTLTGTHFTGATDVNFGSNDIQSCGSSPCFSVDSPTQIT